MPWTIISNATTRPGEGGLRGLISGIAELLGLNRAQSRGVAFTAAVVALSAKLSISDGVALQIEEDTFERVFHIADEELAGVRRLYRLAKQDVAGFEAYARRIGEKLAGEPELKRDVFDALFHIATADGVLHEAENRYLELVANHFGYDQAEYLALRARFAVDVTDPYTVLGVPRSSSDAELKAQYRRLVKENHPDTLIGHGAPHYAIEVAQRKLAGINAAWDTITRERGL